MKGIQVARLGGPEVLEYKELPDPVPEPDQVLVEVRGASVNFADTKARAGGYHLARKPPFIPGLDVAGVVLEVGGDVADIKQGDHVIAFPVSGSYAEQAVANRDLTFVIPETIDFVDAAAAALVAGTVTHMLKHVARIRKDERLLVHAAAGGVGTTALQVAKAFGVSQVIGSIGSPWKAAHVRKAGADDVVDYSSENYAEAVKDMTGGRGVDVIMSPLGGATVNTDLQCLAPFGRLVLFGEMNKEPASLAPDCLYTTNRALLGCSFGHYRRFRPDLVRDTMDTVIGLLADQTIQVFVNACFGLEEASRAHQLLEDRKAVGKIVLVPERYR